MPTIADILKSKITKDGFSKTYVASELKVTEKTIENYMRGKREPDTTKLIKLSKLLEFNMNELSEQIVPTEGEPDITTVNEDAEEYKITIPNYVLPIGELKVTLKDYVDLLSEKADKAVEREKEYLEIIKSKLISIDANSKEIAEDIEALTNENQAAHRALMDTVDIAAKQPIGTTRGAAGIVELASQDAHVSKDKKSVVGKKAETDKKD